MTTLLLTLPEERDSGPAYLLAGLLAVLGCMALLIVDMTSGAPRAVQSLPAAAERLVAKPRADDAAVLLNNTPLEIATADALAINAARKLDRLPLSAARPFLLAGDAIAQRAAALECLTQAVYYEAASESDRGERAVAQVVLNRMRSPLFPHSVCGVVFQGSELRTGCQFSFTCDGSLRRRPSAAGWERARRIAAAALGGWVERSVGLSTHYHADYVVPYWAPSLDKVATIGAHIFYTMRGGLGRPGAFRQPYDAGAEAAPQPALDPGAFDAPTTDAVIAGFAAPPRDRTVVAEDSLGSLATTSVAAPPTAALRADERRSELVADAGAPLAGS